MKFEKNNLKDNFNKINEYKIRVKKSARKII